jgi:hypothetical protein
MASRSTPSHNRHRVQSRFSFRVNSEVRTPVIVERVVADIDSIVEKVSSFPSGRFRALSKELLISPVAGHLQDRRQRPNGHPGDRQVTWVDAHRDKSMTLYDYPQPVLLPHDEHV